MRFGSRSSSTDIVGISFLSRSSDKAKHLLAYLRSMGKRTVWGGIHPTINPEECAQCADVICRVEGEGFMLDLLRRLELGAGAWESRAEAIERRKRASRDL